MAVIAREIGGNLPRRAAASVAPRLWAKEPTPRIITRADVAFLGTDVLRGMCGEKCSGNFLVGGNSRET